MYDDGYPNIVNVDISSVVIEQMKKSNEEKRPTMEWQVADVCDLKDIEDNTFDIAIDKSTIDALLCGENSFINTARMLKETQRVLKTGSGIYFAISYGKPETRDFHFEQPFLGFKMRQFVIYCKEVDTDPQVEADE